MERHLNGGHISIGDASRRDTAFVKVLFGNVCAGGGGWGVGECVGSNPGKFVREMLYLNHFAKVHPRSFQLLSQQSHCGVTTFTNHAHKPFGLQILAQTLVWRTVIIIGKFYEITRENLQHNGETSQKKTRQK